MPDQRVVAQTVMCRSEIRCYQVFLSNRSVKYLQIKYKTNFNVKINIKIIFENKV